MHFSRRLRRFGQTTVFAAAALMLSACQTTDTVRIAGDGALYLNGKPIALENMPKQLRQESLIIETDTQAPFRQVVAVQAMARQAGVRQIKITTVPPGN